MTPAATRGAHRLDDLKQALGGALEWRLLVLWTLGTLVPTAVATVPAWRLFSRTFDNSAHASEIARRFDMLAFEDVGAVFEGAAPALGGATLLATLLTLLISPLLAGASLAAARAAAPIGFTALLQEGVGWYGRMFRMLMVSLLPLAAVGGLASLAFKGAHKYGRHAILESNATWALRAAWLVTILVFVIAHASVEAGRAELGADERLRSAWHAWLRGARRMMSRPLMVLGLYLGVTLAGGVVAAVLLLVRLRITGASIGGFLAGLVVAQLAVAALGWGRASRLFALARLARAGGH
jgi:hypothetical protein